MFHIFAFLCLCSEIISNLTKNSGNTFQKLSETIQQIPTKLQIEHWTESALKFFVSDVPSTPGKPLVMSFSSRTVKLSWAPPLDINNSPVKEYLIKVNWIYFMNKYLFLAKIILKHNYGYTVKFINLCQFLW